MMTLVTPSPEQSRIINHIRKNENVIVDAVAGSGKTTTVLILAKTFPDKNILQITYNASLKLEVRKKCIQYDLQNLEVHSYHSLGRSYYDAGCIDDLGMYKILSNQTKFISHYTSHIWDMVVIDECQDCNPLYHRLVKRILQDNCLPTTQIVLLGDKMQCIFAYRDADVRFLTAGDELFDSVFCKLSLTTSYRVTQPIANFVNDIMLGEKRLHCTREGPPVKIYYGDQFHKGIKEIYSDLLLLLAKDKIQPQDIFILAPSLKKRKKETPLTILEHWLVSANIPCYYPFSDDKSLDERVMDKKVVFSTFHSVKGRERKLVILFGFDNSYFSYYARDFDSRICPSTLYVAATRASQELWVCISHTQQPLPFLQMNYETIRELPYIDFNDFTGPKIKSPKTELKDVYHHITVGELTKHIGIQSELDLDILCQNLFVSERKADNVVKIKSVVEGEYAEEVDDINGLVIPAIFESLNTNSLSYIHRYVLARKGRANMEKKIFIRNKLKDVTDEIDSTKISLSDYLYIGAVYSMLNHDIWSRIKQISSYDWLSQQEVNLCMDNIRKKVGTKPLEYEREIFLCEETLESIPKFIRTIYDTFGKIHISGRLDALDEKRVWEFKCVEKLSLEHRLQVIVYAWMWHQLYKKEPRSFRLFNIRTGECLRLTPKWKIIDKIIFRLLEERFLKKKTEDDREFVKRIKLK